MLLSLLEDTKGIRGCAHVGAALEEAVGGALLYPGQSASLRAD